MKYLTPYNPNLSEKAKKLRNESTKAEVILWKNIKNKQLSVTFYRQKPIGNYIVDFYCAQYKLAVEIDGSSHELKGNYDQERQDSLYRLGVRVLRFTNEDVLQHSEAVVKSIEEYIKGL